MDCMWAPLASVSLSAPLAHQVHLRQVHLQAGPPEIQIRFRIKPPHSNTDKQRFDLSAILMYPQVEVENLQ